MFEDHIIQRAKGWGAVQDEHESVAEQTEMDRGI